MRAHLSLLLLLLATTLLLPNSALAVSNTNACLAALGGLQSCPTGLGVPSSACCAGLNTFNRGGCFYNPLMTTLVGSQGMLALRLILKPVCVVKNPLKWLYWVDESMFNQKTYNGGTCSTSDMQVDNDRVVNSIGFGQTLNTYAKLRPGSGACFDYATFSATLASFSVATPTATIGYGIGSYSGLGPITEYLALYVPVVSNAFWFPELDVSASSEGTVLYVTPDGTGIITGAIGGGSFFNGAYTLPPLYYETDITYAGCDVKLTNVAVRDKSVLTGQPTALSTLSSLYYFGAQYFDAYGAKDVCKFHTKYCTGANQQFVDETECLRFYRALPKVSPACGNGAVMGGNSSTCRFKHHWMSPLEPAAHCFHIGYGDRADDANHFKCNEAVECNANVLTLTGGDATLVNLTPSPQIQAIIDASNAVVNAPGYSWNYTSLCPPSAPTGRRALKFDMDKERALAEGLADIKEVRMLRGAAA